MRGLFSLLVAATFTVAAPLPAEAGERITWWAAGDSYSSGEGIKGSGVSGTARERTCAQSPKAYGPRAAKILESQRSVTTDLRFTGCTGAVTNELYNDRNGGQPRQDTWVDSLGGSTNLDVMSFSFGGNDVGFAPLIQGCVLGGFFGSWSEMAGKKAGCQSPEAELDQRIDNLARGDVDPSFGGPFGPSSTKMTLANLYAHAANTHLARDGVLVVVGYPRLIAPSDQWPAWRHGRCSAIPAADDDVLGRAAERLDRTLISAVKSARTKLTGTRKIQFVSRLTLFDDKGTSHGVCSSSTEWINGTWAPLTAAGGRLQNSFHPNTVGHQVTAEVVAGVVQRHLERRASAVPTAEESAEAEESSPPTITDGTSHQEIGDSFESLCSVAWPTAPSYTSTTIEMTMSCQSAPEAYLFTHVSYPDPDLPINPSTGAVRVRGTVVNQSTSAYGYRVLWVDATDVDLDP